MSKRIHNSRTNSHGRGRPTARQIVRVSWRKRRAREITRLFREARAGIVTVDG